MKVFKNISYPGMVKRKKKKKIQHKPVIIKSTGFF